MTKFYPFYPVTKAVFRPHYYSDGHFSDNTDRGLTPQDMRRIFGFERPMSAEGVKIAVISALDNVSAIEDTRTFCRTFSLPEPEISAFYPSGNALPSTERWLTETCLDLQWISVFAPYAEIFVVFAENPFIDTMLSAAEFAKNLGADVISMCFGTEEGADFTQKSSFFDEGRHVFVASSGDNGGKVSFPSSVPTVLSVGGVDFDTGMGEYVSTLYAYRNSGGGVSDLFAMPQYQRRFYPLPSLAGQNRATPDVSFYAGTTPGAVVCKDSRWTSAGGTSLACACVAGICACIVKENPELLSEGAGSYFYGKAGGDSYDIPQYMFYDVEFGSSGSFYAGRGWDFCTGLGVPSPRLI